MVIFCTVYTVQYSYIQQLVFVSTPSLTGGIGWPIIPTAFTNVLILYLKQCCVLGFTASIYFDGSGSTVDLTNCSYRKCLLKFVKRLNLKLSKFFRGYNLFVSFLSLHGMIRIYRYKVGKSWSWIQILSRNIVLQYQNLLDRERILLFSVVISYSHCLLCVSA